MSYTFRPAVREQTPLIIGLAGPTKSGKTMSALRLAKGMAKGGTIAMINAEGPRGHQYADKFKYVACELVAPYRPDAYTDALLAAKQLNPSVLIIDSVSHMHDGPGGILEWHEEILDRVAGNDYQKRQKSTFVAWVEPKSSENRFIYTLLDMKCPVILAMRAKEKIKIVPGKPPIDLGWQPIVGDRVAFETIFTLMLTPHCKGVPDLSLSDMREPFDGMIIPNRPLDESLGEQLAKWSTGGASVPKGTVLEPGVQDYERDKARAEQSSAAPLAGLVSSPQPASAGVEPAGASGATHYSDRIALAQSVSECSTLLNALVKDQSISVFEVTQLQEAAKAKMAQLRKAK